MIVAAIVATSLLLADLPDETLERLSDLPSGASAAEILSRVREVDGASRFEFGSFSVVADRRFWANTPDPDAGGQLAEFRRWPGDSVLTVYAVAAGEHPPVERATWRPLPAEKGERRFEGTLDTSGGPRPALWCERAVAGATHRIAGLLVPGDGGLGAEGLAAARTELVDLWHRLMPLPEAWKGIVALPEGAKIFPPVSGPVPREGNERSDPWQTVAVPGFTIGLPPGLRGARMDTDVTPPRGIEDAVLWIRGRFRDRDGAAVAVGDATRAGYVAFVQQADAPWLGGKRPIRGSPRATRVDGLPLDEIVLVDTGSRAGRVERWRENGWGGSWLVFRLAFETGRGIEIGLPVEGAWRSLALFWIAATFRPEGWPIAPPPIDAAERLGIRFDRLRSAERTRSPLTEGWLSAPGLRVELPRGWYPVVSIRSDDGFPISVHDAAGERAGTLRRPDASEVAALLQRPGGGWRALERPGVHRAASVYSRSDGARLFVAREGHAFLFEPEGGDDRGAPPAGWARLTGSASLSKLK